MNGFAFELGGGSDRADPAGRAPERTVSVRRGRVDEQSAHVPLAFVNVDARHGAMPSRNRNRATVAE